MTEEELKAMDGGGILLLDNGDHPEVTMELNMDFVKKAAEECADKHGLLKKPAVRSKYTDAMVRDIFIEGFLAGVNMLWEEGRKPIIKVSADGLE